MAKIGTQWAVELENGETLRAASDQRDFAKWEVQPFYNEDRLHLKARFLAWSASTREGLYKGTFEKFNERDCIEVSVAGEDGEGEQGLDPGRSDTAAGA
jgi:hypothetical protein